MHCNVFQIWFEFCENISIGYTVSEKWKASVSAENFAIALKMYQ